MSGLLRTLAMGCVCGRESVTVDGRRFHVKNRLGEGGFSYVDLVEDATTHRKFALKRVTCHSEDDQRLAIEEAEYMRALMHPNLLPLEVCSVHCTNDRSQSAISEVLIVMPFYRVAKLCVDMLSSNLLTTRSTDPRAAMILRGTVHDEFEMLNAKGSHIELQRVLRLFRGICKGLSALHNHTPQPLAHRDLKPANVLLAEDDTPILMDFGSMGPTRVDIKTSAQARQLQDLAAERCSMPYRAPELFNVENHTVVDERVDIWSLGCTLYALCYHESPFDKTYQQGGSIALAVLSNNIRYPDNDPYPVEMRDLIQSMMVVNAPERPYLDAVMAHAETLQQNTLNQI